MTTERELLKQIWENDGRIPLQLITKRLGIGTGYIGYLCKELLTKDLIKKSERDRYKVTAKGRKSLAKPELITSVKKLPTRQHVAYKKRIYKKRKGGKKKVAKKFRKRIRKKLKRRKKSTIKKVAREIKQKTKKEGEKVLAKDGKISSIERVPAKDSKIAKKEPNKLLKIFKDFFSTKRKIRTRP